MKLLSLDLYKKINKGFQSDDSDGTPSGESSRFGFSDGNGNGEGCGNGEGSGEGSGDGDGDNSGDGYRFGFSNGDSDRRLWSLQRIG